MRYNEIDHDIISQVIAEDAARRKPAPIAQTTAQTTAQMIRRSINPHNAAAMIATMREDKDSKRVYHFEDGSYLVFAITFTAVEEGVL